MENVEFGSTDILKLLVSYERYKKKTKETGAMRLGGALHSLLLQGKEYFNANFLRTECKTESKAYQDIALSNPAKTVLLYGEGLTLDALSRAYDGHRLLPQRDAKNCIFERVIRYKRNDGITLRATPDALMKTSENHYSLIDIKTTSKVPYGTEEACRFVFNERYYVQLAMYGHTLEQAKKGTVIDEYSIVILPTVEPYTPIVLPVGKEFIQMGLELTFKAIDLYKEYVANGYKTPDKHFVYSVIEPREWMLNSIANQFQIEQKQTNLLPGGV